MKKRKKNIIVCPKDKEYKMMIFYDQNIAGNNLLAPFQLMCDGLRGSSWQLIDLEKIRDAISQDFEYLILFRRFTSLKLWSKNKLKYDENGFHLDEHNFDSLDEVEKALELKAFL